MPCEEEWFQGDIVLTFKFTVSDLVKRSASTRLFNKKGIVVTQTCDLQRRPFVQICPIHDFAYLRSELIKNGKSKEQAESFIASVRGKKTNYYYYLEGNQDFNLNEGYADLNMINTVSLEQLKQLSRLASISDYQRQVLAYQVGNLFLRPH